VATQSKWNHCVVVYNFIRVTIVMSTQVVKFSVFIFTLVASLASFGAGANKNEYLSQDSRKLIPLDVVVGLTKPPYVDQQTDSGFELDIVRQVFANFGHEPRFIYVPLGRSIKLLDQGMGDALLTVNRNIVPNDNIRTNPYITYQNVAVSLKSKDISIDKFSDLVDYKVAAFQLAHKYLGAEFQRVVAQNNHYVELPNQFQQVKMLLEGRVDAVIMDINIFTFMFNSASSGMSFDDIIIHEIFPENKYSMAFKEKGMVEEFNRELDAYLESEHYASLLKKYHIKN
jgi:polar amino acid transport system substrate-binding protein